MGEDDLKKTMLPGADTNSHKKHFGALFRSAGSGQRKDAMLDVAQQLREAQIETKGKHLQHGK